MKNIIFFSILFGLTTTANAGSISRNAELPENNKTSIGNLYTASPSDIADTVYVYNKDIQHMIDDYTTEEMALYVIGINRQERQIAKENNQPIPDKLTKEILSDKEKMGEYLRSLNRFKY